MLGIIVGGRIGYVLFYNIKECLHNPLEIFAVWHGGMSFHGGMICTIIFGYFFCNKYGYNFYKLADPTAVVAPIGLGLGRIGNLINAELYGRPTDVPWAMIFPGETISRHPSQIYEFLLEGVLLFVILFILIKKKVRDGFVFWSFIFLYGAFRFFVEFFREPDPQLGHLISFLTMGQILSALMVIAGIIGYISIFSLPQKK